MRGQERKGRMRGRERGEGREGERREGRGEEEEVERETLSVLEVNLHKMVDIK